MKKIVAVAFAFVSSMGWAQTMMPINTGNEFLEVAKIMGKAEPTTVEHVSLIRMLGVVAGIREANMAIRAINSVSGVTVSAVACVPDGVTTGQLASVLKAELEKDPKNLHNSFSILSQFALIRVYPCSTK